MDNTFNKIFSEVGFSQDKIFAIQKRRPTIRSRRLATATIFNLTLLAKLCYNGSKLAHSQAP
jgi:hypothetical protein